MYYRYIYFTVACLIITTSQLHPAIKRAYRTAQALHTSRRLQSFSTLHCRPNPQMGNSNHKRLLAACALSAGVGAIIGSESGRVQVMHQWNKLCGNTDDTTIRLSVSGNVPEEAPKTIMISPLHFAVISDNITMIQEILSTGAPVNNTDSEGATPLQAAAVLGHFQAAEILITHGANVNLAQRGNRQPTPLHLAAVQNHPKMITLFAAHGADVDATDAHGWTPLHQATKHKNKECCIELLKAEANPNATNYGLTPLHIATLLGHRDIVSVLLDEDGVDASRPGVSNITPLHIAAQRCHVEIAKLLVNAGADKQAQAAGQTPFDLCDDCTKEQQRIFATLLS